MKISRILIADDSSTARMFIRKSLSIVGFSSCEFIEAENGLEALRCMKNHAPDMLVTDITMPEMDGMALMRHIQRDPDLPDIPIIVITSVVNDAREPILKRMGALAVIHKPLTPSKLYQIISPVLAES